MKKFILLILLMVVPFFFQLFVINNLYLNRCHGVFLKSIDKLMGEQQLEDLTNILFNGKISYQYFQYIRVLVCVFFYLLVFSNSGLPLLSIVETLALYKGFYYLLKIEYNSKITKISNEMPYFIKNVIYLSYDNPIVIAIAKAIVYADSVLENDLLQLVENINTQPRSYSPYQEYIDKYKGKIKHLDYYFRSLYRISESRDDDNKLLDSLNKTVSDDLNIVRNQKNRITNDIIGYLGLIPVVILVIFLTALLIMTINFM